MSVWFLGPQLLACDAQSLLALLQIRDAGFYMVQIAIELLHMGVPVGASNLLGPSYTETLCKT